MARRVHTSMARWGLTTGRCRGWNVDATMAVARLTHGQSVCRTFGASSERRVDGLRLTCDYC